MGHYILEGKEPKKVTDLMEWAKGYEKMNRRVEQTHIGEIHISTVFLGIDHSFIGGPPLLFETMVFGGKEDGHMERYTTWDEAEKGHHRICEMVINSL